jgi:citrate lyase beta subunit
MLALRSILAIRGADEALYAGARSTAADAVLFDLATPEVLAGLAAARRLAAEQIDPAARAKRTVLVRVGDARSREMEEDLEAVVGTGLAAVVLAGAEVPQDVRDADVAIRKREMRRGLTPGAVRLVPEVDSAAGLRALPAHLAAVDRHAAVALHLDGLRFHMQLGDRAEALHDHAMADVALAARAVGLPWVLTGFDPRRGSGSVATRAHDFGAVGVEVRNEAEARGMNALFTPTPEDVAAARAAIQEWERLRSRGQWIGTVEASGGPRLVDRRTVRLARAVVAMADAIERRESGR